MVGSVYDGDIRFNLLTTLLPSHTRTCTPTHPPTHTHLSLLKALFPKSQEQHHLRVHYSHSINVGDVPSDDSLWTW